MKKQMYCKQKSKKGLWCVLLTAAIGWTLIMSAPLFAGAAAVDDFNISGLSATTTDNDPGSWKFDKTEKTLTGSVSPSESSGSCGSTNYTGRTTTLTLTNTTNDTISVTFSYTVPSNSNSTLTIDGTKCTTAGVKTITLDSNKKSATVVLAGHNGNYTPTITLSGFGVTTVREIDVTFPVVTGVVYQVNGTEVSEVKGPYTNTANNDTTYTITTQTSGAGYYFVGADDTTNGGILKNVGYCTLCPEVSCVVTPRFVYDDDGVAPFIVSSGANAGEYWSWESAFSAVGKGMVILNDDYVLPNDLPGNGMTADGTYVKSVDGTIVYEIGKDADFLIPFDEKNTASFASEIENNWGGKQTNSHDLLEKGKLTTVERNILYRTLTVADGTRIECYGDINVNGQRQQDGQPYTGVSMGRYGKIILGQETPEVFADPKEEDLIPQLIMHSGSLYCYGYITGTGMVEMKNGSKLHELIQFCDWPGATNAALNWPPAVKGKNALFLMGQFYIQSVEAPLRFYAGATGYGEAVVGGSNDTYGEAYKSAAAVYAGANEGLFRMENGSHYTRIYDHTVDRIYYHFYGNASIGSIHIEKNIKIGITGLFNFDIDINSADYVLQLPNNMELHIESGAEMTVPYDMAIMPGAKVIVEKGGIVNNSGKLYIVDEKDWSGDIFMSRANHGYMVALEGETTESAPKYNALPYVATLDSISPRAAGVQLGETSEGDGLYYVSSDPNQRPASGKLVVDGTLNVTGDGGLYVTSGRAAARTSDRYSKMNGLHSTDHLIDGSGGTINFDPGTQADPEHLWGGYSDSLTEIYTEKARGNLEGIGPAEPFVAAADAKVTYLGLENDEHRGKWYTTSTDGRYYAYGAETASGEVARVKSTGLTYPSLKIAVAAAQPSGDTVTLLQDVTLTETLHIPVGKNLTLDLNGKTITYNGVALQNDGELSVIGGKITGNSGSSSFDWNYTTLSVYMREGRTETFSELVHNRGTLSMDGTVVEQTGTSGSYSVALLNHDTGVIESLTGVTLTNRSTSGNTFALYNLGGTIKLIDGAILKGTSGLFNYNIASAGWRDANTSGSGDSLWEREAYVFEPDIAKIGTIKDMDLDATGGYALINAGIIDEITGNTNIYTAGQYAIYNHSHWYSGNLQNITSIRYPGGDSKKEQERAAQDVVYEQDIRPTINKITGNTYLESKSSCTLENLGVIGEIRGDSSGAGVIIKTNGMYYALRNRWKIDGIHGKVTMLGQTMVLTNGGSDSEQHDSHLAASKEYRWNGDVRTNDYFYDEDSYARIGAIGGETGDNVQIKADFVATTGDNCWGAIYNTAVIDLIGKGTTVTTTTTTANKNAWGIYNLGDLRRGTKEVTTSTAQAITHNGTSYTHFTEFARTHYYSPDVVEFKDENGVPYLGATIRKIDGVTITVQAKTASSFSPSYVNYTAGIKNWGVIDEILNSKINVTGNSYENIVNLPEGYYTDSRTVRSYYAGSSAFAKTTELKTGVKTDSIERGRSTIGKIDGCTINGYRHVLVNNGYIGSIENTYVSASNWNAIRNLGTPVAMTTYQVPTFAQGSASYTVTAGAETKSYHGPATIHLIGGGTQARAPSYCIENAGRIDRIVGEEGNKVFLKGTWDGSANQNYGALMLLNGDWYKDGKRQGASVGELDYVDIYSAGASGIHLRDTVGNLATPITIEAISENVISVSTKEDGIRLSGNAVIGEISGGYYRGISSSTANRANAIVNPDAQNYGEGKTLSSQPKSISVRTDTNTYANISCYYVFTAAAGTVTGEEPGKPVDPVLQETLAAAIAAYKNMDKSNTYIVLQSNFKEAGNIQLTEDIYLDLNGHTVDLSGITFDLNGHNLYLMDSGTNGYMQNDKDVAGAIEGQITNSQTKGSVVSVYTADRGANNGKTYVICQGGEDGISAHRAAFSVTGIQFAFDSAANAGSGKGYLTFRGTLRGDADVLESLDALGFSINNAAASNVNWKEVTGAHGLHAYYTTSLASADAVNTVAGMMDFGGEYAPGPKCQVIPLLESIKGEIAESDLSAGQKALLEAYFSNLK